MALVRNGLAWDNTAKMKIGIYLGRYEHPQGGLWVYARSVMLEVRRLLESGELTGRNEVIFYGDRSLLDSVQAIEPRVGAIRYRLLPTIGGRKVSLLLDQLILPFVFVRDRVELVHALANAGFVFSRVPQIVTVHDLFQAWPATSATTKRRKSTLVNRYYRTLFRRQFNMPISILTDSTEVAQEITHRYGVHESRIRVVPLGVDEVFANQLKRLDERNFREKLSEWLVAHKLQPGYVLILASAEPRKNLKRTIGAWLRLPDELKRCGLVVNLTDARAETLVRELLQSTDDADYLRILPAQPRDALPYLFKGASVLLHPTLGEGFGLPALEAVTLKGKVVSGALPSIADLGDDLIYFCNPSDETDINRALVSALQNGREVQGEGSIKFRTMAETVRETVNLYEEFYLRFRDA